MNSIAILEAVNTSYVPFNGQHLITTMAAGIAYVAMKPIVENIGLSWSSQVQKLLKMKDKFNYVDIDMVAGDGRKRLMGCLPLKKLNGWLFSINPEKVRADIRDKLIQYQEECFTVLHDYWTKGQSVNPRKTSTDERTPLRDAVNLLVGKKNIMYPEAYSYVHQRFNVARIEDLDASQIPIAIEYIHKLALEGELMPKEETPPYDFDFRMHSINSNALCVLLTQSREIFRKDLEPALRLIDSPVAGKICGRLTDACVAQH
jgi:hypothetical protein